MAEKIPKTGRAKRMRAWMKERRRPFSPRQVCDGLGVDDPGERDLVRNSISDFLERGEVILTPSGKYKYNHSWKSGRKSPVKKKVLKAMHVFNGRFSTSDIQRLSEAPTVNYVQNIIRKLASDGYVQRVGRRPYKSGMEWLYVVADRNRFRIEVIG